MGTLAYTFSDSTNVDDFVGQEEGMSETSKFISKTATEAKMHFFDSMTGRKLDPSIQFSDLKTEWLNATRTFSSLEKMFMHPSYQQIIGMGEKVVPFLLKDLFASPEHWYWALTSITSRNPVQFEEFGDLEKMSLAWIKWGLNEGYIR